MSRVSRNIDLDEARDLLERVPRACVVAARGDDPDAWPVTFTFDDGRYFVVMPGDARRPDAGEEVVVLVDEGIHFFDLRAVYIRGRVRPVDAAGSFEVEPMKVVAWDYGRLRDVDDDA